MKTDSDTTPGSVGRILWCFFLVCALIGAPLGCASMSKPETLKQTEIHMSWQMTRFQNAIAAGRLTTGEKESGNAAYTAYQTAFAQALQAAHGNRDAPTPQNVTDAANAAIQVFSGIAY